MKTKQIEELKASLLKEQSRLEELLERTSKHLYRRDKPYSADFAEQVVEVENNQVVEVLDHEAKLEQQEIKRALLRIEQGTYEQCSACGESIGEARLQAIPHASMCLTCASNV